MCEIEERENLLYIAYGSNLNVAQMKIRCPYATVVGNATLKDYQLLFRGGNGGSVATVEPKDGSSVPVLIWEITPRCEDALDRYEGWPRFYRKETVAVEFGSKLVETMVYIMNDGHPLGSPSQGYLNTIVEGYKTAGFDQQVLSDAITASALCPKRPNFRWESAE